MKNLHFTPQRGMLLVLSFFLVISSLLGAQTQPSERVQQLDKAILSMWLEEASDQTLATLQQIATGVHDGVWGKALFHLACGKLMKGGRNQANECFRELEKEAGNPEIARFIVPLKNLLAPDPKQDRKLTLEIHEKLIEEAIQLVARQSNRAVIIDSGLEEKRISLHLPTTNFEQVMKILGDLGNFETKMVGDILLVSPSKKSLEGLVDESGKLDLDLKDVDVREALRFVAIRGKMNLVFHKNVGGQITIRLAEVAPLEALRMITRAADLFLEKDGENYLVMNLSEKEKLSGKSDVLTVPMKYLDAKEAMILLRGIKLMYVEPTKEGNALMMKGDPELLEKARDLILSQDKPQQPVQISIKIWEILKNNSLKPEEFPKLSNDQKKEMARLLSSPRIITIPGRMATIEIGSNDKANDKEMLNLNLDILPVSMGEDMIKLEMKCKIRMFTEDSGKKKESLREFASTFVVKMDSPFAYEVQGGAVPTLMEILVSKAQ